MYLTGDTFFHNFLEKVFVVYIRQDFLIMTIFFSWCLGAGSCEIVVLFFLVFVPKYLGYSTPL